jgi:hypothetical protein
MLVTTCTPKLDGSTAVRMVPLGSDLAEVMVELVPLSERSD